MMRRLILAAAAVLVLFTANAYGVYDLGRDLKTVKTKYFDIIYAENSKDTAFYIASFADGQYEKINSYLRNTYFNRVTVVVSGDKDEPDGYANVVPTAPVITIFDVPATIDSTVGNSRDFVKYEFFHELVHVFSLTKRSDFLNFFAMIFGEWVYPHAATPMFMVEGVTVSFESLEGEGRVNYPLISHDLRQDIIDDNFKKPQQSAGTFNTYPNRRIFYHYGGYFSSYLQKKYGMDKYRELWAAMGSNIFAAMGNGLNMSLFDAYLPFALLGNIFGPGCAFKSVYNVSIEDEWNLFKKSMAYQGKLDVNSKKLIEDSLDLSGVVTVNQTLYYLDQNNASINCLNLKTRQNQVLIEGEGMESISVSADGVKMLVTRYQYRDVNAGLNTAVIQEFDLKRNCYTGREIRGYREAAYMNDDIIAIRAQNHYTDLVKIDRQGKVQTLLAGTSTLYFGQPQQLNQDELVMLVNDNGEMKVGRYSFKTREAHVLDAPVRYVRNISVKEGKVLFAYNNDMTFFKLAVLDGQNLTLQTNNISGGVFYPVVDGDNVYYGARFSAGQKLMVYPETLPALTGQKQQASFVRLAASDDVSAQIVAKPDGAVVGGYTPLAYTWPRSWIPTIGFKGYSGLDYRTAQEWIFNPSSFYGVDTFGIYTRFQDPTALNQFSLGASYTLNYNFANWDFRWDGNWLPVKYRIFASDSLNYDADMNIYLRNLGGALNLYHTFHFISVNQFLTIGLWGDYSMLSLDLDANSSDDQIPYYWDLYRDNFIPQVYFRLGLYTMYDTYRVYGYRRGVEINGWVQTPIHLQAGAEGNEVFAPYIFTGGDIRIYPYYIPVSLVLKGAFANNRNAITFSSMNYYEFSSSRQNSLYYGGADLQAELLNFSINNGLPLYLPLYINSISLLAGYRAALMDDLWYRHSAYARVNVTMPYLYGAYAQIKTIFYAEAFYRINYNDIGFRLGLEFGRQLGSD